MITPAYTPTATERVLPRLALDFTTGVLDPRVTVTRALNTATRINSSGYIETVNANLPRFDYDPLTKAPRGLLIEETRTNVIVASQNFADASWTKSRSTVTPTTAVVAPDGTNSCYYWAEDTSASTTHRIFAAPQTFATGTTYPFVFYARKDTRDQIFMRRLGESSDGNAVLFDLTALTATVVGGAVTLAAIYDIGNDWRKCVMVATGIGGNQAYVALAVNGSPTYTGNGTSGMYIWAADVQTGSFATSYIPTSAGAATRNADVVQMTGANFSDWFNASEGAFVVEASTPPSGTYSPIVQIDSGSANNRIALGQTASGFADYSVVSGGVAQASFQSTAIANSTAAIAGVYKTDSFARSVNAEPISTDNLGSIPTVTNLKIGSNLTPLYFNRHIRKIRYYNQRILNAEAVAFSKL